MEDPILRFDGISKRFHRVQAVDDVSLEVDRGAVLGLIGENGAGKSTLMNVLGGVVEPDSGALFLDGEAYAPESPADAAEAGIAFIHQELNLFPNLSIADNLLLDRYPRGATEVLVDRSALHREAVELLDAVGLDRSPETAVERLSPGERQLVEIARALGQDARIVIFDEPTTSLTTRESEHLFELIDRLRAQETTILYISHTLDEIHRLTDRVAVLRDGRLVDEGPTDAFPTDRMITSMVGRSLEQMFPDPPPPPDPDADPLLEARSITQPGVLKDVSLTVRTGELVGLFGLMGSGRTELARMLFGLDPFSEGEIWMEGHPLDSLSPAEQIDRGMAFVTEDRREEGLMMDGSVIENVGLAALRQYATTLLGVVRDRRLRTAVGERIDALDLKTSDPERQPAQTLSGGNQQKAVLARWLLTEPKVFLMDEPTRGIDVGAKTEVYSLMGELARGGAGILFISSELDELLGVCHRIVVMAHGEIQGVFGRDEFDKEQILRRAFREQ